MADKSTISVEIELEPVQWIGFITSLEIILEEEMKSVNQARNDITEDAQSINELLEKDRSQAQKLSPFGLSSILQSVVEQASQQLWGQDSPPDVAVDEQE